ncbi:MAG: protoheme IX farnesyltransferase, partial [Flexibacter sp. CG_4_10_14_3_um_filter_32_15]
LVKKGDNKSALMLMFSSFFYLPIVQLALLFDKL